MDCRKKVVDNLICNFQQEDIVKMDEEEEEEDREKRRWVEANILLEKMKLEDVVEILDIKIVD